jgi:hypothetical protein
VAVALLAAEVAGRQAAGALVGAVAVVTAAAVIGQALQRGPDGLPVAAPAGGVVAGLGAQQPSRPDPVAPAPLPLGYRRLRVIAPPAGTLAVAAAALRRPARPSAGPPVDAVAGAAARSSWAVLSQACFAGGGWCRP